MNSVDLGFTQQKGRNPMTRIVFLFFLLVSSAYATKPQPPQSQPSIAAAGAIAGSKSVSGAHAGANAVNKLTVNIQSPGGDQFSTPTTVSAGGGQGGRGGAASASTGDSSSNQQQKQKQDQANSQTVTAGPDGNVNDTYEDYTAAAYAPSVQPTVPCMLPLSGGIVLPALGSLSAGSGTIDVECERREAVRIGLSSSDSKTRGMANAVMQQMLSKMLEVEEPTQASVIRVPTKTVNNYDSLFGD